MNISKATAGVALELLNALAILSDTTVEDLQLIKETENHIGNQKKGPITQGDQLSYYLQVFQKLY